MRSRIFSAFPILLILGLYLGLALSGVRYGLPNADHPLSYNCDELQWIEALMHVRSAERHHNPYPELDHPTFYMEAYGAALGGAALSGYIPLHGDKEWYNQRRDIFARVYLVGRFLQVVFGAALLLVMYGVGRKVFGQPAAIIATLLTAVSPGFVAVSQFSQNNMPVTAMAFFALSCFLLDDYYKGARRQWLLLGAFLTGLAMSTKYSAAPLALPMAYRWWKSSERGKTFILCAALVGLGFEIGDPFALLFPKSFAEGYLYMQRCLIYDVDTFWHRTVFPFVVTLPHTLGFWLSCAVLLAVVFGFFNGMRSPVLWLWSLSFWLGFLVVGRNATPARTLVFMPPLLLLTADQAVRFKDWFKIPHLAFYMGIGALVAATLLPTLAVDTSRRAMPIQVESSDWIKTHLPRGSSIGTPRYIYWWSPDVVYQSAIHPDREPGPYRVYDLEFSLEKLQQTKPDYLVVSTHERQMAPPDSKLFDGLDHSGSYRLIKEFPRRLSWCGWVWERPELRWHADDDLRVSTLAIYQRNE